MNSISRVITVIIVILLLPSNMFFGDFRYDTCKDHDLNTSGNYVDVESYEGFYYVCRIGYIEGYVGIGWEAFGVVPDNTAVSISILNSNNLNRFISGESYGHSNTDLAKLQRDSIGSALRANSVISENSYTNLIGDNYYLVINLGYRTSFEKEDVEKKTISEEYVTLSRQISMTDFDPKIECKIDLDYLDENQQAIS